MAYIIYELTNAGKNALDNNISFLKLILIKR